MSTKSIFFNLFLQFILGEELYDFRDCYQEKIAINILAQLPANETRANAILLFLEDFERIRNNYGNMQPMRFSLLEKTGISIQKHLIFANCDSKMLLFNKNQYGMKIIRISFSPTENQMSKMNIRIPENTTRTNTRSNIIFSMI